MRGEADGGIWDEGSERREEGWEISGNTQMLESGHANLLLHNISKFLIRQSGTDRHTQAIL